MAQLRACRQGLIEPCITAHQGSVVKTTGDGMLVRFVSPVEAVRCAVEIQEGMTGRNAELPDNKRLKFRIGINLGDVIVEDGDIFGDAVNVAARLEAVAEPGGICISRSVRDQVRDSVPFAFEILENNGSKISPDHCAFTGLARALPTNLRRHRLQPKGLHLPCPISRRSRCCRSQI